MATTDVLIKTIDMLQTVNNLYDFSAEVDKVTEALFKSGTIAEGSSEYSLYLAKITQGMSRDSACELLNDLKEDLTKTPKLLMTLAFKPDAKFTNQLFLWVKTTVGPSYLLELAYDPDIIGGSVIVYNGLYKDFSLKKDMTRFFEDKNALQTLF